MSYNLKIIDRPLKKGEYFIYRASDIRRIIIDDKYNDMLFDEMIFEEILNDKYLLFTYLGKGLAREKYSSEIFNVYRELSYGDENLLDEIPCYRKSAFKKQDFYKGYKMSLRNPLIIISQEGYKEPRLYEFDRVSRGLLKDNDGLENQIGNTIRRISKNAKENLVKQMNEVINNDYEVALFENNSDNLKKTLK